MSRASNTGNASNQSSERNALRSFITNQFTKRRNQSRKRARVEYEMPCESLPMCGYHIKLPHGVKPYKSQKLMIVKILTALKTQTHAMVESPTGSGKTLGLLASTCAWLLEWKKKASEARINCAIHGEGVLKSGLNFTMNATMDQSMASPSTSNTDQAIDADLTVSPLREKNGWETINISPPSGFTTVTGSVLQDDCGFKTVHQLDYEFDKDNEEMVTPKANRKISALKTSSTPSIIDLTCEGDVPTPQPLKKENKLEETLQCTCENRVRLYYCSRTHKQITQVVKEFSRLPYGDKLKHTILASREQLCVNKSVRESSDMTAQCKERISEHGLGCTYRDNMKRSFAQSNPKAAGQMRELIARNAPDVWDVEDLRESLTDSRSPMCPYFTSTRLLTIDADIIFCPFSYLIDPIIRVSSDVHLKNSVVILDEAHNVEDFCRDAATFTFTDKEVIDTVSSYEEQLTKLDDFIKATTGQLQQQERIFESNDDQMKLEDKVVLYKDHRECLSTMVALSRRIYEWMKECANDVGYPAKGLSKSSKNFKFSDLYTSLEAKRLLFPPDSVEYKQVMMAWQRSHVSGGRSDEVGEETAQQELSQFKPSGVAIVCIEKLLYFQEFFCPNDNKTMYRMNVCVEKPNVWSETKSGAGPKNVLYTQNSWRDSHKETLPSLYVEHKTSLGLWCMSPSLAFNGALADCRTVVLASGTLTPADTFESELAMDFKHKMEGDQVIPSDRIFACIVNRGPSGGTMIANYQNTSQDSSPFTTELSKIIFSVCERTPGGVLCFFPSYRLMESVKQFMESPRGDAMMQKLKRIKMVLSEPRRSSELNGVMEQFENAVRTPHRVGTSCTGAIMFAVFRGKVSEGIDFADDLARCVISVGIPFPSAYDDQVIEKKKYNNENCKTRRLLTGDVWYSTQAYRALNQALGRCLRHRNDWGALVLIDDRLIPQMNPANPTKISKWIRNQLKNYPEYWQFELEYTEFMEKMSDEGTGEGERQLIERPDVIVE